MSVEDVLYEPICDHVVVVQAYPFGVGDFVRLSIGLITPFGAIVCGINEVSRAVEVWSQQKGTSSQFWILPGPDCVIHLIRKATSDEIAYASAQGMIMAT